MRLDPASSRASWKQRFFSIFLALTFADMAWHGWQELHADFIVQRGIGYMELLFGVLFALMFIATGLFGSMPITVRLMLDPSMYRKTFQETSSDAARLKEEERKRSRGM